MTMIDLRKDRKPINMEEIENVIKGSSPSPPSCKAYEIWEKHRIL